MSTSVWLPLLWLVAHASARLEIKINAAAAILDTQIDTCVALPEYLFFPLEFYNSFPRSYQLNRTRQSIQASNTKHRPICNSRKTLVHFHRLEPHYRRIDSRDFGRRSFDAR